MKSKKTAVITVISLFLLIAVLCVIELYRGTSYMGIIRGNWDISLPANCKEIYQVDNGLGINGDGFRYHVFQYKTDITLNSLVPEQGFSDADTSRIFKILSELHVEKAYYPDFDTITFSAVQKHTDNSKLSLCYSPQKVLYVIEEFY